LPEKFGTRSVSRNPIISSLFHRAGYIEKMGTGISRIKNALKEAGNPGPIFEFDSFFTTIFQRDMEAGKKMKEIDFEQLCYHSWQPNEPLKLRTDIFTIDLNTKISRPNKGGFE